MTLLDSLLDAILRLDGEALVMHAGEKPYVVLSSASMSTFRGPLAWGQVELSSRPLTSDAVLGMLAQMLSAEQSRELDEYGAIEQEIDAPGDSGERFVVTAARGGDDVWVEVRRRTTTVAVAPSPPEEVRTPQEKPAVALEPEPIAAEQPEPVEPARPAPEPAIQVVAEDDTHEIALEEPEEVHEIHAIEEDLTAIMDAATGSAPIFEIASRPGFTTQTEASRVADEDEHEADVFDIPADSVPGIERDPHFAPVFELRVPEEIDKEPAPAVIDEEPRFAEQRVGEIAEQKVAEIAEQKISEIAQQKVDEIAEQKVAQAAEQKVAEIARHKVTDVAEQHVAEIAGQRVSEVAEQQIAEIAGQRVTEIAERKVGQIAEQKVTEAAEQKVAEIARQRVSDVAEQQVAEIAGQRVSEVAEQHIAEIAAQRVTEVAEQKIAEIAEQRVAALAAQKIGEIAEQQVAEIAAQKVAELVEQKFTAAVEQTRAAQAEGPETAGEPEFEATPVVVPHARPAFKLHQPAPPPAAPAASTEASLVDLLRAAAAEGASTVYAVVDTRPMMRVEGEISLVGTHPSLAGGDVERFIFEFAPRDQIADPAPEWTCIVPGVGRVRCVTFHDQSGAGLILHLPASDVSTADELGIPLELQALCEEADGLVVVAGPRSSGKSTLLSAFVDLINRTRYDHVITIESQIRKVHEKRLSFISQREVRGDGAAIAAAARAALREGPDVLVIEDLRAPEALVAALDAARAGRLVFGSISARTAPAAIERLIDAFPADRRPQVRASFAGSLRAVIAQLLVPKASGGRTAAREVLLSSPAVRKLVLDGAVEQLPIAIESGRSLGMTTMVDSLGALVRDGVVETGDACACAPDRAALISALERDGIDVTGVERRA